MNLYSRWDAKGETYNRVSLDLVSLMIGLTFRGKEACYRLTKVA